MSNINIGSFDGFRLFLPAPEIIPESRVISDAANRTNQRFLLSGESPGHAEDILPITGSFIYAHAPDYVGGNTLQWGVDEWDRAFQTMRAQQLDTVVFQAAAWGELEEVYYPSRTFSSFRMWNVIEPMLTAAERNDLTVFMGGYGSISGWNRALDTGSALFEIRRQSACMEELLERWGTQFPGIYYSPETAFCEPRDRRHETMLNWIYRTYFEHIKGRAPEKKILMSPGGGCPIGREQEFIDSWLTILHKVPLDILAPQDSIGCCGCDLVNLPRVWNLWRSISDHLGIELWANVELFERVDYGGASPFCNADPRRILMQRHSVTPFVSKCICWEALNFELG